MPVSPGDPIRIHAQTWNRLEAIANRDGFGAPGAPAELANLPGLRIRARNSSETEHIDQYDLVQLKQPDIDPETVVLARSRPLFEIGPAAWYTSLGNLVIAAEPIPAGGIGWVTLSGVAIATVQVGVTTHQYASLDPADPTRLRSGQCGEVRLWTPGGTGSRKCVVELGRQQLLWRYKLTADFSGSSAAAVLLGLSGTTAWHADAAVSIVDPDALMDDQVIDDVGWCFQTGNTFHAINAPC